MGRTYKFQNLTGGLNTVSSIGTINQSSRRTESPDMMNVEYYGLGGIASMEGNTAIGNKLNSAISGGWEYTQGNNKYMIITTVDGGVYIYNAATEVFDLLYTFPSESNRTSFCNMNNGVVITNGIDDPVFYIRNRHQLITGGVAITSGSKTVTGDGTIFQTELSVGDSLEIGDNIYFVASIASDTSLELTSNALETLSNQNAYISTLTVVNAKLVNSDDPAYEQPIKGLAIQYYKGRLWIGSGSTIFYSQLGQYNKWDIKYGAGGMGDFYNDTSDVKALGLFGDYMMIHKEYFTYKLSGGNDPNDWSLQPYSNISCESQQSWTVSNNKYFVYSTSNMGIYPLTQYTIFSNSYVGNEISERIRNIFQDLRDQDLENIFIVTHPRKRWVMFYMPFYGYLGSSKAVILDLQTNSWLIRAVPQVVTVAFRYDNNVYIGTQDGKILREMSGRTFDGGFLDAYWKSPWFALGDDSYFKTFDEFNIQISEEENNTFRLRGYRDGESNFTERIVTNDLPDVFALVWDSINTNPDNDTEWDNNDWVKSKQLNFRFPMELNYSNTYQIELRTAELNQGFSCFGFSFRRTEFAEDRW